MRIGRAVRVILDGDDEIGQPGDHGRRVAKSAAQIQNHVAGQDVECVQQLGQRSRLQHHAPAAKGQVLADIGGLALRGRNEPFARHAQHGVDDGKLRHVGRPDLGIHHHRATPVEVCHV